MPERCYRIKNNRFKTAENFGFMTEGTDTLYREATMEFDDSMIFFAPIDSTQEEGEWGRLHLDVETTGDVAYMVYVAASDHKADIKGATYFDLTRLYEILECKRFVQVEDILLYELKGRYLYIEIRCTGTGTARIRNIWVDRDGDNFMQTFPRIYQEENSFFHRFMSVFSSVYNDLEQEINHLPELLNLDTADPGLLIIYAKWMGIDVGEGYLPDDILRNLVKNAYALNRMKGTRWCMKTLSKILLGEEAVIVERNITEDHISAEHMDTINRLYGNSIYDVTLLISRELSELDKSRMMDIVKQFVPARCNLHIVELGRTGALDSHIYLDMNARIYITDEGNMDEQHALDAAIVLS